MWLLRIAFLGPLGCLAVMPPCPGQLCPLFLGAWFCDLCCLPCPLRPPSQGVHASSVLGFTCWEHVCAENPHTHGSAALSFQPVAVPRA